MAKEITHERKGHLITELATGKVMDLKTINKAKFESRIQQKGGGWVVRVAAHSPVVTKRAKSWRPPKTHRTASRAEDRRVSNWDMHARFVADDMLTRAEQDD